MNNFIGVSYVRFTFVYCCLERREECGRALEGALVEIHGTLRMQFDFSGTIWAHLECKHVYT